MDFLRIYSNNKDNIKKIIATIVLILALGCFKSFLGLALLTAIQVVLASKLSSFIYKKVLKEKYLSSKAINVISFIVMMSTIVFCLFSIVPNIIDLVSSLKDVNLDGIMKFLQSKHLDFIKKEELASEFKQIGVFSLKFFSQIEKTGVSVFVSFILSFFYLLNENEIKEFMKGFENCKCKFYYNFYKSIAKIFMNSFVRILEAQMVIAFVNSVLSAIMLTIMGFDNIIVLGVMIFILSLIPVVGTIISLIPLSVMAYQLGGFMKIVYVIIMITVIHALESYILNPKIMSKTMKMPEFFTFLVLLISEHYIGTWGLIIGLPLFMFTLDILGVEQKSKKNEKIEKPKTKGDK